MYFGFSEEEKMLQTSVKRTFNKNFPMEEVRVFMEQQEVSNNMKKLMADQGLIGMLTSNGNGIEGALPTIAVFEEAGRSLIPYPLMENVIGAYLLSKDSSKKEMYEQVVGGKILLSFAWGKNVNISTIKVNSSYLINGKFTNIPFAKQADKIIIKLDMGSEANHNTIVALLETKNSSINIIERDSMDQTYPMSDIEVENYRLTEDSIILDINNNVNERIMTLSALLSSAEMLGISEEVLKRSVDYSLVRKQFGKEIGRFQAIKHMAADMYVLVESSRVAVLYAAWALQEGVEPEAISIAKAYTSDAATKVTGLGIQIHGGIGFTWESDMHLFFKRARRAASMFGDVYYHRELAMQKLEKMVDNLNYQKVGN